MTSTSTYYPVEIYNDLGHRAWIVMKRDTGAFFKGLALGQETRFDTKAEAQQEADCRNAKEWHFVEEAQE